MTAILGIVLKFLPYIVDAAKTVPQLVDFVQQLRAIFARDKVWTDAEEAEFDEKIESLRNDPAWKIDD